MRKKEFTGISAIFIVVNWLATKFIDGEFMSGELLQERACDNGARCDIEDG